MISMIGQSPLRKEDQRFLTGRGQFADDINVEGQAYAFMVTSVHAHADIRDIEISAAKDATRIPLGSLSGSRSTMAE